MAIRWVKHAHNAVFGTLLIERQPGDRHGRPGRDHPAVDGRGHPRAGGSRDPRDEAGSRRPPGQAGDLHRLRAASAPRGLSAHHRPRSAGSPTSSARRSTRSCGKALERVADILDEVHQGRACLQVDLKVHGCPHEPRSPPPATPTSIDLAEMFTQETWDARYAESERIWSGNPNPRLVDHVADLSPGDALDVGCGEGADAVWLAKQGWRVTALDVSAGRAREGRRARARGRRRRPSDAAAPRPDERRAAAGGVRPGLDAVHAPAAGAVRRRPPPGRGGGAARRRPCWSSPTTPTTSRPASASRTAPTCCSLPSGWCRRSAPTTGTSGSPPRRPGSR